MQILPSNLKEWDEVKDKPHQECKNPEWYGWYLHDRFQKWFPHRKPTVNEIVNDQFKESNP